MNDDLLAFASGVVPLNVPSSQFKPVVHKATKTCKKRSWKKPKDKPKRPLSAYNLFFQRERNEILAALPSDNEPINDGLTEEQRRRKHRKHHGKIGFADLARMIANKWKNCDEESRSVFEAQANIEKDRYKRELAEWKLSQDESDAKALESKSNSAVKDATESSNSITDKQFMQSSSRPDALTSMMITPALMKAMPNPLLGQHLALFNRGSTTSSIHEALMAQCAENLRRQSSCFEIPLATFAQNMNGRRMQSPMANPTLPEKLSTESTLPDETFSKETFFEMPIDGDDDDDESTCSTSELFSESDGEQVENDASFSSVLGNFLSHDFDADVFL
jgi:hypothetical protein